MAERSIAKAVAGVLQARGAPPSKRPFTDAEWAVIAEHGRPAVDVELRRLEELLQDDGFYRSGCTKGLYPQIDPFEGFERNVPGTKVGK